MAVRVRSGPASKVLLIGWDAADWRIIDPLLQAGQMPALQGLIDRGVRGRLATLQPPYSPMLWTSIATGKRPEDHGVLGFVEPMPGGDGVRPVSAMSRRTRALWNMLTLEGLRSNLVGWWPSHPAEPIDGVIVSDLYQKVTAERPEDWKLSPETVWPRRLVKPLAEFRVHPAELDYGQVAPFVPGLEIIDSTKDVRLAMLMKLIAETASVQGAATALMQLEPWDFMGVYFDGLDHFSHGFARYHPPRLPWVSEADFAVYREVVSGAYRFHDMMLGVLLDLAGPETTVVLVSDHGFHANHLRRPELPAEPAGPAREHAPYGIFVAAGPGIRQGASIYGAGLLDVCPTVLQLYGLPMGADMPGRPLFEVLEGPASTEVIESWDRVSGHAGELPLEDRISVEEREAAIAQLVDLGYLEAVPEDGLQAAREAQRELDWNLAKALEASGRHSEAAALFASLFETWPEELRFGLALFQSRYRHGPSEGLRALWERIFANKQALMETGRRTLAEENTETPHDLDQAHAAARARARRKQVQQALLNPLAVAQLEAMTLEREEKPEAALRVIDDLPEPNRPGMPIWAYRADLLRKMKRYAEAELAYRSMLEHDPDAVEAALGLGRVLLRQERAYEAAAEAFGVIEKQFDSPEAHALLGMALERVGQLPRAAEAYEQALRLRPLAGDMMERLERVYDGLARPREAESLRWRRRLLDPPTAAHGRVEETGEAEFGPGSLRVWLPTFPPARPPEKLDETVVVVSGLPRSGTSMVMRMLEAGGVPVWIDDSARPADPNNPHGYFERPEAVTIRRDTSWLPAARGKAFKLIAPLLGYLPEGVSCRVVLINRDIEEVLDSQARMLARSGKAEKTAQRPGLRRVSTRQMQLAAQLLLRRRTPTLVLEHGRVIAHAADVAAELDAFLGGGWNISAMAAAVDASLYRERRDSH